MSYVEIPGVIAMDEDGWASGPLVTVTKLTREKLYTAKNTMEMFATHSIVGEENEFQDGIPNRFPSMDKDEDGRFTPYAAASCQVVFRKNGDIIQMYKPDDSTWTSGSREANTRSLNSELEGGGYHADGTANFEEPMTDAQVESFCAWMVITERWITKKTGRPHVWVEGVNVFPHKTMVAKFGGGRTACDSGRYRRGLDRLPQFRKEKEDMGITREELDNVVGALVRDIWGSPERRAELVAGGNSPLETRVTRFERNDGPIGVRLAAIEAEAKRQATKLDSHTSAPHTADGLRGEIVDAFGAAAAFLNGED